MCWDQLRIINCGNRPWFTHPKYYSLPLHLSPPVGWIFCCKRWMVQLVVLFAPSLIASLFASLFAQFLWVYLPVFPNFCCGQCWRACQGSRKLKFTARRPEVCCKGSWSLLLDILMFSVRGPKVRLPYLPYFVPTVFCCSLKFSIEVPKVFFFSMSVAEV